jgi:hypothetical protein
VHAITRRHHREVTPGESAFSAPGIITYPWQICHRRALIDQEECVLRYDNEFGKGDHRHRGTSETAYRFTTIEQLLNDFNVDTRNYLDEHPHHR